MESVDIASGSWWRASQYEIRDGCIRPCADPERYDPWAEQKVQPAYVSLLNLVDNFSESALLKWCASFGLLGSLLHATMMVALKPRRQRWRNATGKSRRVLQVRYVHHHLGWTVIGAFLPAAVVPAGVVLCPEAGRLAWQHERLGQTWARFFPKVPRARREAYAYPMPGTAPFWRLYSEPVDAFVETARTFRKAVEQATDSKAGVGELRALNALLLPVGPAAGPGRTAIQFRCTTLLGSLAMWALHERSGGRRLLRCAWMRCAQLFQPETHHQRFCTPKCKGAYQQRAWRKRQKRNRPSRKAPDRMTGDRR